MPITRRYWTTSPNGTPIEVTETDSPAMTQPNQVQYISIPVTQIEGGIQPQASTPIETYQRQPAMVRPITRSPLPYMAAAAGIFLGLYSWTATETIGSLKQENGNLTQQVLQLRAENQALKEMAAIVR